MADKTNGKTTGKGKNGKNGKTVEVPKVEPKETAVTTSAEETVVETAEDQEKEPKGECKIAIDSIESAVANLVEAKHVGADLPELIKAGKVEAFKDFVQVSKNTYYGEYVRFAVADTVLDMDAGDERDAAIGEALLSICGGRVVGGEKDQVSLLKAALYGQDLFSRNRTSQRVRSLAEGPDKAFERMVKQLMDSRGFSREKAEAKVRKAMAEDDE